MQEIDRKPATTTAVAPHPPPFSGPPAPSSTSAALDATSTLSLKAAPVETGGGQGGAAELELLLLSGKRRRVQVSRAETVEQLIERVWSDWPAEWRASDPAPASASDLRLLHLGRFLEPESTLSDAGLFSHAFDQDDTAKDARPTVVHLQIRTLRPPDAKPGGKVKAGTADDDDEACCACCVVS
ncbi:hypothetical protein JCM3775_000706 [Rhodotorula graminis]